MFIIGIVILAAGMLVSGTITQIKTKKFAEMLFYEKLSDKEKLAIDTERKL